MSNRVNVLREAEAERDSYYQNVSSDITYASNHERGVITVQPHTSERITRCPLPILSANLDQGTSSYLIPLSGIQLLNGVDQLYIQHLFESTSQHESSNVYAVKKMEGETIFRAVESSESWQRYCCRSRRAFQMHLFDQTRQEAMYISRRLACPEMCSPFFLQKLDVFIPDSEFIGSIEQKWSPLWPQFIIKNAQQDHLYYIIGPTNLFFCKNRDAEFKIISAKGIADSTKISCNWDASSNDYRLYITFSSLTLNATIKVLLLASAFLLEYMFYQIYGWKR